jgi:hypothetical protein
MQPRLDSFQFITDVDTSYSNPAKRKNVTTFEFKLQQIETSSYLSPYKTIKDLETIYFFENYNDIMQFLRSNLDLVPLLVEAPIYIYDIFGGVPIFLEVHSDPEENWDELFIVIKTTLPAEEAVKREMQLFDIWFSHVIQKVGNRLNYTEEPL